MKTLVILLLTNDYELEDLAGQAFSEVGGVSHLVHDADEALRTVCGVPSLDLAIIDFEHAPYGMALLSVINTLREQLPVIVITRHERHLAEVAYTKGAAAFLAKPVSAPHLIRAICQLRGTRLNRA